MVPTKGGTRVNCVCAICKRVVFWYPSKKGYPINAKYISSEERMKGR